MYSYLTPSLILRLEGEEEKEEVPKGRKLV
jgi:hypothetical protein